VLTWTGCYVFEPIATTLGVLSTRQLVHQLLSLIDSRIAQVSWEATETSFLFRRCSVLVQRVNAVLCTTVCLSDCTDG